MADEKNVFQDLEATTREILSGLAKSAGDETVNEIKPDELLNEDQNTTLLKSIQESMGNLWSLFKGESGGKGKHGEPDEDDETPEFEDYEPNEMPDEGGEKTEKSFIQAMGPVFNALDKNNANFGKAFNFLFKRMDDQDRKITALAQANMALLGVQKSLTSSVAGISEIFKKPQPFQGQIVNMRKSPSDGLPIDDIGLHLGRMSYVDQQPWIGESGAVIKAFEAGKISDDQSSAICSDRIIPRNLIPVIQPFFGK